MLCILFTIFSNFDGIPNIESGPQTFFYISMLLMPIGGLVRLSNGMVRIVPAWLG